MEAHKQDNRLRYEDDALYNAQAQACYPWWTEYVISGKGVEHFWRGDKPPTLLDPSPIWNFIFGMVN